MIERPNSKLEAPVVPTWPLREDPFSDIAVTGPEVAVVRMFNPALAFSHMQKMPARKPGPYFDAAPPAYVSGGFRPGCGHISGDAV